MTPSETNPDTRQPKWVTYATAAMLAAVMIAVCIGRIRLAPMPLERDEGEYAYMGQLLLQGEPPYKEAFNMKLPGTSMAYAVLMTVFGETQRGIHYGLLLVTVMTAGFVCMLGRQLVSWATGFLAAACYLILSFMIQLHGTSANTEHFVMLFAVAGLWLMLRTLETERLWSLIVSGLLLGTAALMKQHGAVFAVVGGLVLLIDQVQHRPLRWGRLVGGMGVLVISVVLPLAAVMLWLALAGTFETFWYWIYEYPQHYVAQLPASEGWKLLKGIVTMIAWRSEQFSHPDAPPGAWLLLLVSSTGLAMLALDRSMWRHAFFVLSLLVLSFVAVCPGYFFRPHYFLYMPPVVALLFGVGLTSMMRLGRLGAKARPQVPTAIVLVVAGAVLSICVAQQSSIWFDKDPDEVTRIVFPGNPFAEAMEFGRLVREDRKPNATIAIIGSEPQIPFYADCRSATGYIYMYPLMENHDEAERMQKEAIEDIVSARPEYVVYVLNPASWLPQRNASDRIFQWFQRFIVLDYDVVAVGATTSSNEQGKFDASTIHGGEEAREIARRVWPHQSAIIGRKYPPVMILFKRHASPFGHSESTWLR